MSKRTSKTVAIALKLHPAVGEIHLSSCKAQSRLRNTIISYVIVLVNYALNECIKYNKIAHDFALRFISCDACGVFGQVFVDFGSQFECTDLTG
eukprot:997797_1